MVSDFVIGVLTTVVRTILSWMPTITVPEWLQVGGEVSTLLGMASSMAVWVPLGLLVTVLVAILTAYGIAFGIKIVRIVASFVTFGGGSAA